MLAKITSKNQLTLPKSIVTSLPETDYTLAVVGNADALVTGDNDLLSCTRAKSPEGVFV